MATESSNSQMVIHLKESIKTIDLMALEHIVGRMERAFMKGILKME